MNEKPIHVWDNERMDEDENERMNVWAEGNEWAVWNEWDKLHEWNEWNGYDMNLSRNAMA